MYYILVFVHICIHIRVCVHILVCIYEFPRTRPPPRGCRRPGGRLAPVPVSAPYYMVFNLYVRVFVHRCVCIYELPRIRIYLCVYTRWRYTFPRIPPPRGRRPPGGSVAPVPVSMHIYEYLYIYYILVFVHICTYTSTCAYIWVHIRVSTYTTSTSRMSPTRRSPCTGTRQRPL